MPGPYVDAFSGVATEPTLLAVLAELGQKLEAGQSIVVSGVGGTVAVAGTVALDAPTLAALETISVLQGGPWSASISDGGGSITVDGTVTAIGPLTDTQLRATPVPVSGTVGLDSATLSALETINVLGPLTDAQLRAAAVPVSGPLTDVQLRAAPVPVSGTVATGSLTDAQLRASAVAVSGPLTDTQLRAVPVPVSGTVAAILAEPISVDDNGASLTTDGTYDERYSGGKLAVATTVTAAGDTTLVTPPGGQRVRVVWVSAIANPDNLSANRTRFKFGAAGAPFYESYAVAHWEVFDGGIGVPLIVNCQTAEAVSVTAHYRII